MNKQTRINNYELKSNKQGQTLLLISLLKRRIRIIVISLYLQNRLKPISQNASGKRLSSSWVGFACAHPHARDIGYFRVILHRPTFFTSLSACRLSLPADRAPADRFNFTGKSRKRLVFRFNFKIRLFGSTKPGERRGSTWRQTETRRFC